MQRTTVYKIKILGKKLSRELYFTELPNMCAIQTVVHDEIRAKEEELSSLPETDIEIASDTINRQITELSQCIELLNAARGLPTINVDDGEEVRHPIKVAGTSIGWIYISLIPAFTRHLDRRSLEEAVA